MSTIPNDLATIKNMSTNFDKEASREFIQTQPKRSWSEDFKLLYEMVRSKSFELDQKTLITITGALAYVVMPLDAIPDVIPIIGWLDDSIVLKLVVDSFKGEIGRFRDYKNESTL